MSEIWNANSVIEEKYSKCSAPQIEQLRINFNIRDIDKIINRYQSNGQISENDYFNLCWFLDSKYGKQFFERSEYVKELFGDKLKNEYFKIKLNSNKDKILNYKYQLIYDYFVENKLDEANIDYFRDCLYDAMKKIPELFKLDMLSNEYKMKIDTVLPIDEIKKRDREYIAFNQQSEKITTFLYQKKLVNELIKNEVLKNLPQNYSNLEKSIYVYIKLCQLLSYDPYYYANKNKNRSQHQEFSNIFKIGIETNNVICYEFVTIFSEILKDMGLNVISTTQLDMDVDDNDELIYVGFSDQHSNLQYIADDIIVFADSSTSVLSGDIINAKMENQLNGLKCFSVEQSKKDKFDSSLNKVYGDLQVENTIFKKYGKEVKEKKLVDKLKILFDDISDNFFNPTDFISYIANIKHDLFTTEELDWNLKISFIGKNRGDIYYPVSLFSVNTNDIKNIKEDTVHYLYDPHERFVVKLEKEELEEMFSDGSLFFIDGSMNIPNINTTQNINFKGR